MTDFLLRGAATFSDSTADPITERYRKRMRSRSTSTMTEMEQYLEINTMLPSDTSTDVLKWWSAKRSTFPTISLMARDYLCIPATSASVERIFSRCRDLIDFRRCALLEETITTCTCLKSWFSNEEVFL
jgi:hypothetical protein